jgi:hypothetical protein
MGLDISTSTLLQEWIGRYGISGPLLTLGVQQANFELAQFCAVTGRVPPEGDPERVPTATELMRLCGIGETFSLDISAYEGADFLFDLNNDCPPSHLLSRFGAILNGGTLEHVFNIPHALTAITRMLRPGGIIIHVVPVHNWIDHGFYQISPTLLYDYYMTARFDILESAGLVLTAEGGASCTVIPVAPGDLAGNRGFMDSAVLCMFAARKTDTALEVVTPVQSVYTRNPAHPPPSLRWFPPYSIRGGMRRDSYCARYVLESFTPEEGLAWLAPLPTGVCAGDTSETPHRSSLVLFEDARLLGPAHAMHATIRADGGGCYSHWHDYLLFSTSDGSDPNRNGRCYSAIIA